MRVLNQPEPLVLINVHLTTTAPVAPLFEAGCSCFPSVGWGQTHGSTGVRLSFNEEAAFISPPWRLAVFEKFTVLFKDAKY